MYLTTRQNKSYWVDSFSKQGRRFVSYQDSLPIQLRALFYGTVVYIILGYVTLTLIAADDWPAWSQITLMTTEFGISLVCGWVLANSRLPNEAQLLESGVLTSQRSYAFEQLTAKLAELQIYISDMNDKLDHEVGVRHIVAYLRATRKQTELLDRDNITVEQRIELENFVVYLARSYATLIRGNFDARELAHQALRRGQYEEASRLQAAREEQQTMIDQTYAEFLIEAQRRGLAG